MARPAAMAAWRLFPIVDVMLQATDEGSLVDRMLPRLRDLMDGDCASWWVVRDGGTAVRSDPGGRSAVDPDRVYARDALLRWENDAAIRRSDLAAAAQEDPRFQLAFGFRDRAGRRDRIVVSRNERDFTPAELLMAEGLRPRILLALARLEPLIRPQWMTARETAVLDLVVEGLTNKQIASRLGISPRTVGKHLEHSYAKLNEPCRVGAAMRWRASAVR